MNCGEITMALKKCVDAHPEYYGKLSEAPKAEVKEEPMEVKKPTEVEEPVEVKKPTDVEEPVEKEEQDCF